MRPPAPHRAVVVVVGGLAALSGCTPGPGRAKGGGGAARECGYNTIDLGDSCECAEPYAWCDADSLDCCAFDTTDFQIVLEGFTVFPLKETGEPWDWDGSIPDELLLLFDVIGSFDPHAYAISEVLEQVDTYAPYLMEGTVPPDPWIDFYQGQDFLDSTSTFDDTYDVSPRTVHTLDLTQGEWYFQVTDEDLAAHDDIGDFYITLDDAQWTAGRTTVWNYGSLWEIAVSIEPMN